MADNQFTTATSKAAKTGNLKISELPELTAIPDGEDVWMAVVHDGTTKRVKLSVLLP